MIYLKHDTINKVALTLNENLLISATPSFIFEFVSEWNMDVYTYSFSDLSSASYLFNLFDITLSSSASSTQSVIDGSINMIPGQYVYNVYDDNNLLESGMLVVEKKDIGNITNNPQNIYY